MLERKQENEKYKYICKACGRDEFKTWESFFDHAVRHTKEKNYICRIPGCTAAFYRWPYLKEHLLTHSENQQNCESCEMTFKHELAFKSHMKMHQREHDHRAQVEQLILENGGTAYKGDLDLEKVIEFHRKINEKPTSWQQIVERWKLDGKFTYKCKICGEDTFGNFEHFLRHALKHTGEKTYICRLPGCSSAYSIWRSLRSHLKTHFESHSDLKLVSTTVEEYDNPRQEFDCEKTNQLQTEEPQSTSSTWEIEMIEEDELDCENVNHTPPGQMSEEEDDEVFDKENPSLEELVQFHEKFNVKEKVLAKFTENIYGGELKLRCTACGTESKDQIHHEAHVLIHSGDKLWKCRVLDCRKTFRDFPSLEGHLLSHSDQKKYICEICGTYFESQENLAKHAPIHTTEKTYKCDYCSSVYLRDKEKRSHMKMHDPGNEILLTCNYCDAVYLTGLARSIHVKRVHHIKKATLPETNRRRYACDICWKTYKTKSGLDTHYKDHTNEREYQCEYCSASFKDFYFKNRHEKNHNPGEEVLLDCDFCENVFLNTWVLNSHLKRDHGVIIKKRRNMDEVDEDEMIE